MGDLLLSIDGEEVPEDCSPVVSIIAQASLPPLLLSSSLSYRHSCTPFSFELRSPPSFLFLFPILGALNYILAARQTFLSLSL